MPASTTLTHERRRDWPDSAVHGYSLLLSMNKEAAEIYANGSLDDIRAWSATRWRWMLVAIEHILRDEGANTFREELELLHIPWEGASEMSHTDWSIHAKSMVESVLDLGPVVRMQKISENMGNRDDNLAQRKMPSPAREMDMYRRAEEDRVRSSAIDQSPEHRLPATISLRVLRAPVTQSSLRVNSTSSTEGAGTIAAHTWIDRAPRRPRKRPQSPLEDTSGSDEPETKKTRFDFQLKHPYTPYDLGKSLTFTNCSHGRKMFYDIVKSEADFISEEQSKGMECLLFRDLQSERSIDNLVCHIMAYSSLSRIGLRWAAVQRDMRLEHVPPDAQNFADQCRNFVAGFWASQLQEPLTPIDQLKHYHTLYSSHVSFHQMRNEFEQREKNPELHQWLSRLAEGSPNRSKKKISILNRALETLLGFPHEVQTKGSTKLTRHLHKCEAVHKFVDYLGGPGALPLLIPPNQARERKIYNILGQRVPFSVADPILKQMSPHFEPVRALGRIIDDHVIKSLVRWGWKAPNSSTGTPDLQELKNDLRKGGFERVATLIDTKQSMRALGEQEDTSSDEGDIQDYHRIYEESEAEVRSENLIMRLTDLPHLSQSPKASPQRQSILSRPANE